MQGNCKGNSGSDSGFPAAIGLHGRAGWNGLLAPGLIEDVNGRGRKDATGVHRPRRSRKDAPQEQPPASYRIYKLEDGAFGVEITMQDRFPARITSFPSRTMADQWIKDHREKLEQQRRPELRPSYFTPFKRRPPT